MQYECRTEIDAATLRSLGGFANRPTDFVCGAGRVDLEAGDAGHQRYAHQPRAAMPAPGTASAVSAEWQF